MLWWDSLHLLRARKERRWRQRVAGTGVSQTPRAWESKPCAFLPPLEAGTCLKTENMAGVGRASVLAEPWFHLVLLHLPALRSSCLLVIRYLKNSYTDQAMAVEGIW